MHQSKKTQYATLEPRIRHVPERTVRKKWKTLSTSSQERVKQLIENLCRNTEATLDQADGLKRNTRRSTKKRKVPNEEDGDQNDEGTQKSDIQEIADKLCSRIPRMPFPPSTIEEHFDYEATLQRISNLETQLTTNTQSINLLRIQIAKEEQQLEHERKEMEQLEKSLRATEAMRKSQAKTLHPLAKNLDLVDSGANSRWDVLNSKRNISKNIWEDTTQTPTTMAALQDDPDVGPLLAQLRNHLDSMHGNVEVMKPVLDAVGNAKVSLARWNHENLDDEQYQRMTGLGLMR